MKNWLLLVVLWTGLYLIAGLLVVFIVPSGVQKDELSVLIQIIWLMPLCILAFYLAWSNYKKEKNNATGQ